MSLSRGTRLGQFEIAELVGVGGMGEVYRATDTKLGRDVAIKVLPGAIALDDERLARFNREARLLASLDHPNICAVHDLQESDGTHFMVMPLIEGDTLGDRIARGAIPVEEALLIFAQIAEALEAAHEQGIIHRDLKPGNIKVSDEGKVKVLDFGIGKVIEYEKRTSSDEVPTRPMTPSSKMTQDGVVMGTPVYMSPEQARGKPVDKRTDIWAFGCCLYEALTGNVPFQGETVSDTLAKVLERDPDWDKLPPDIPPHLRVLLRKCLQKDSTLRLRDIGDARIDVRDLITESGRIKAVADESPTGRWRSYVVAASVVLGAVVIAAALFFALRKEVPPSESITKAVSAPVRRYSINLSPDAPLEPMQPQGGGTDIAVSPDGLLLVYVARTGPDQHQLFLRRLDQLDDARPLAGTEHAVDAFFSPDGEWIGFFTHDKLKKVSVRGGAAITLCDVSANLGASWGDDGHIVFSSGIGGLKRISAAGGPVEELMDESFMESQGLLAAASPVSLPGGKSVLYMHIAGFSIEEIGIAALNMETGEAKILMEGAVPTGYHPTGHLIYSVERAVMAAPFDPGALEITGPGVAVTEENMALMPAFSFPVLYDFSTEGTLVYVPGTEDPPEVSVNRTLVWVDREGNEEPVGARPRPYSYVDLSPDGTHAAVLINDPQDPFDMGDIWILDLTRETVTQQRLTFDPQTLYNPMWTPDSQRIVFGTVREGAVSLSSMAANGTGPVESLHTSRNFLMASTWSTDGRTMVFEEIVGQSNSNIWALSLDGESTARPLMTESYKEEFPVISPDGRWIAYESDQSRPGGGGIYVRPYPNIEDGKWPISPQGGEAPMWAPDGRELYYYAGRMMAVTIETEPAFAAGNPEELFRGEYFVTVSNRPYDISPDGKRFLMIKEDTEAQDATEPDETPPITELIVVDNWDGVLRDLANVAGK